VGLIRPIDAAARPNAIVPDDNRSPLFGGAAGVRRGLKTFEETGVRLGMHTFGWTVAGRQPGLGSGTWSLGEYLGMAGVDTQTLSFI
jgi:hypothetical protein